MLKTEFSILLIVLACSLLSLWLPWMKAIEIAFILVLCAAWIKNNTAKEIRQKIESMNKVIGESTKAQGDLEKQTTSFLESLESQKSASDSISESLEKATKVHHSYAGFLKNVISFVESSITSAAEGKKDADSAVKLMEIIERQAKELKRVAADFETIKNETDIINKIVDKTNLLSFNAAIESAAAGEHGKGFSVVAYEVKKLAALSLDAATRINGALDASEASIESALETNGLITEDVDSYIKRMRDRSETMFSLCENVKDASQMVAEGAQSQTVSFEKMGRDGEHIHNHILTNLAAVSKTEEARKALIAIIERLNMEIALIQELFYGKVIHLACDQFAKKLEDFHIVDVRRLDEFHGDLGHVEGAQLKTLGSPLREYLEKMDKSKHYAFICRSGGRSAKAATIAKSMGFSHVVNVEGGMLEWNKLNLPVVKKKSEDFAKAS